MRQNTALLIVVLVVSSALTGNVIPLVVALAGLGLVGTMWCLRSSQIKNEMASRETLSANFQSRPQRRNMMGVTTRSLSLPPALVRSLATMAMVMIGTCSAQAAIFPIISGLEAHFNAEAFGIAQGFSGGESVSSWTDETGNGHDATQATVNRYPTYVTGAVGGQPAIRFVTNATSADGGDDNLVTDNFIGNPYSVFAVVQMAGTENGRSISYGAGGSNWLLGTWSNTQNRMYAGGFLTATSQSVDTLTHLWTGTGSGTLTSFYRDGAFQADSASFLDAPGILSFSGTGAGEHSDVDIAEVLVYSRVLTDDERNLVGGYIQEKYGLTIADAVVIEVPEPSSLVLLALGVVGLTTRRRRRVGSVVQSRC